jgi:hypothetical protein
MAREKSDSLWNWLGRQVGHVKKAVKTDVTKTAAGGADAASSAPAEPQAAEPVAATDAAKVIYRDESAEEVELPDRPGVKLRRTVIDEVIVDGKDEGGRMRDEADRGS